MVGLIIDSSDIDNDVFDEVCDIIQGFPDTITDIKVTVRNQYQFDQFLKTIETRKMLDHIVFMNKRYAKKHKGSKCQSFQATYSTDEDSFII